LSHASSPYRIISKLAIFTDILDSFPLYVQFMNICQIFSYVLAHASKNSLKLSFLWLRIPSHLIFCLLSLLFNYFSPNLPWLFFESCLLSSEYSITIMQMKYIQVLTTEISIDNEFVAWERPRWWIADRPWNSWVLTRLKENFRGTPENLANCPVRYLQYTARPKCAYFFWGCFWLLWVKQTDHHNVGEPHSSYQLKKRTKEYAPVSKREFWSSQLKTSSATLALPGSAVDFCLETQTATLFRLSSPAGCTKL
jgi:hypothetical protein